MSWRFRLSSSVTKLIATPFLPKRPPRPILQIRNFFYIKFSVADPDPPDQHVFGPPGSELSPSRIRMKEFKYFNPKKWILSSRKYDPGCSSRIWMLTLYPSRIPGSKRHRIPETQHCGQVPGTTQKEVHWQAVGSKIYPTTLRIRIRPESALFFRIRIHINQMFS